MPKRLFSDKAWTSDKLESVKEEFRAEYAWIYSLALCDGTFECDPKKVWSACYAPVRQTTGRGGWTVARVAELLDELARRGLLLRRNDAEGKAWGKWTNCEDCLPPRCDWHKHQRGKGFLFDAPANGQPLDDQSPASRPQGIRFGLDLEQEQEQGSAPAAAEKPTKMSMAELLPGDGERVRTSVDHNGRKKGQPGYYDRGQYYGTNPKAIHKQIASAWQRAKGSEGAFAQYPSKYPERWELLCESVPVDIIVPAFELWCEKEGQFLNSCRFPADDFSRSATKYTEMVQPTKEARPRITPELIAATNAQAAKVRIEAWDAMTPQDAEPGAAEFLAEESN